MFGRFWRRGHATRPAWRWPLKLLLFAVICGLVLYPKVWLIPTWIARLSDMNTALQPSHPGLEPLVEAVRARTADELTRLAAEWALYQSSEGDAASPLPSSNVDVTPPKRAEDLAPDAEEALGVRDRVVLRQVAQVVEEVVPYRFDWETWGVMDFLPNVDETLRLGHEDCDGRAVVAASLLRRIGYDAWLVSDIEHTWVETRSGSVLRGGPRTPTLTTVPANVVLPRDADSPRGGAAGTRVDWTVAGGNLLQGMAFGVSVFPRVRLLLIVLTAGLLLMHPWSAAWRRVAGLAALVGAVGVLGFVDVSARAPERDAWALRFAMLLLAAGLLMLALRGRLVASERPGADQRGSASTTR